MTQRPARILSLDGGGIRGLSALLILEHIMNQIADDEKVEPGTLKPCDYFDIICGTSTGGLIAILLGRLGLTTREAIDLYLDLISKVFAKDRSINIAGLHLSKSGEARFDEKILEKEIRHIVKDRTGSETTRMFQPEDNQAQRRCFVFVVAVFADNTNNGQPHLFKNYDRNDPTMIWEAARATSAAPTFFKAIDVGIPPVRYIDAGFGYNNPAEVAHEEFHRLWPQRRIGLFISLGTGKESLAAIRRKSSWTGFRNQTDLVIALEKMTTSANRVHNSIRQSLRRAYGSDSYVRLNVDQGLSEIGLQEWKRVGELAGCTQAYLAADEIDQQKMACANRLRKLSSMPRKYTVPATAFRVASMDQMDNNYPGMRYWYPEIITETGYPAAVTVAPEFTQSTVLPVGNEVFSLRRVCNLLLRGQASNIPHGQYRVTWIIWLWASRDPGQQGVTQIHRQENTVIERRFPSTIPNLAAPETDSPYFHPWNILFSVGRAKDPSTFEHIEVDADRIPLAAPVLLLPGYQESKLEPGAWNTLKNTGWAAFGSQVVEVELDGHLAFVISKCFERKWIGGFAFGGVRLEPLP